MPVLVGKQHIFKVDRKGRVSVPKLFRDALSQQQGGFAGVYAYPLFTAPAIEVCDEEFMTQIAESLDDMDMFSDDQDDLASILLESAYQLPFDPEGRIVIPEDLREHAGIDSEVQFVGRGRRFRIWNPATYAEKRADAFKRAKARGTTLALVPKGRRKGRDEKWEDDA